MKNENIQGSVLNQRNLESRSQNSEVKEEYGGGRVDGLQFTVDR